MAGETDLDVMLATLRVERRADPVTVVTVPDPVAVGAGVAAVLVEDEGTTAVVTIAEAERRGWPVGFRAAWLTVAVHSSLEAVGLTAALSAALARRGIACNVLAGHHHDHLLVPLDRADEAVAALEALATGSSPPGAERVEVVGTRTVVMCGDCGAFWDPAAEAAACTDATHEHHRFASHLHRTPVTFGDGTVVVAVSFGSADPYAREVSPAYGLYLDERWRPPWPHDHLDWPDFGVPDDPAPVVEALGALLRRARAGQRVEIGCYGGHGRTGTALACLAVLCGEPPDDAVGWVRAGYCERAVETEDQEAFVRSLPAQR